MTTLFPLKIFLHTRVSKTLSEYLDDYFNVLDWVINVRNCSKCQQIIVYWTSMESMIWRLIYRLFIVRENLTNIRNKIHKDYSKTILNPCSGDYSKCCFYLQPAAAVQSRLPFAWGLQMKHEVIYCYTYSNGNCNDINIII